MTTAMLAGLNITLVGLLLWWVMRKGLLSQVSRGRTYLTWLAVAVITLMDEFTSVFYAPAEAYRFLGISAIFFIAITSLLIRFYSSRLVEIAQTLEANNLIGGGVYSFSYLALGPVVSFVAVASIMVDYVLTACISAVSAVENAASFLALAPETKLVIVLAIIWAVAGLNILGIRENARFTFGIFAVAGLVILNLLALGVMNLDAQSLERMHESVRVSTGMLTSGSFIHNFDDFIAAVASCILAYSGVESVLQTAGLVRSWHDIRKAYIFLALTVGLVTPLIAALALSANIDFAAHEGDLITFYSTMVGGVPFGLVVATLASLTLIMAVNTAFVASSELMERVAHRYHFDWLAALNPRGSLYRIHLLSASFFSSIVFITSGQQNILADMYALGLIASFGINLGALLIWRYFKGAGQVSHPTNRPATLVLWVVMVSCFIFLALEKPHGTMLWAAVTTMVLVLGMAVSRRRAPERREMEKTESQMDLVLQLAESEAGDVHLHFRRPREESLAQARDNQAYLSFYVPRQKAPARLAPNHYRLPLRKQGLNQAMVSLLRVVEYELGEREIWVHFGWPMSSWWDRLAIGVMIFHLMRLPRLFPRMHFDISYPGRTPGPQATAGG